MFKKITPFINQLNHHIASSNYTIIVHQLSQFELFQNIMSLICMLQSLFT